jgi:hypothetical protein
MIYRLPKESIIKIVIILPMAFVSVNGRLSRIPSYSSFTKSVALKPEAIIMSGP